VALRHLGRLPGVGLAVCANYKAVPTVDPCWKNCSAVSPPSAGAPPNCFVCFGWLVFFYPVSDALRIVHLLFSSPDPSACLMSPVEILGALRRLPLAPRTTLFGMLLGFGALCILGRQRR